MPQINFSMLHSTIRVEFHLEKVYSVSDAWRSEYGTECYRIAGAEHFDRLDQAKRLIKQNLDLLVMVILSASNTIGVVVS